VGKPKGKTLPGTSKHISYNIKMDLKETGWEGMDLINEAQFGDKCRSLVKW